MQLYTVAGWVIYVLVSAPDQDAVNGKQADAFFGSLKLTEKAQEVFRKVNR